MERQITKLILSNDPDIKTNSVFFEDSDEEIKLKNKKPFITKQPATLTIIFNDDSYLKLSAPAYYRFDGATIPFGIGKGNMKLQIPALFHDIVCDNKSLINYDRKLASLIFKECLIECGVNKIAAHIMYLCVEGWQIINQGWRINKNEKLCNKTL